MFVMHGQHHKALMRMQSLNLVRKQSEVTIFFTAQFDVCRSQKRKYI